MELINKLPTEINDNSFPGETRTWSLLDNVKIALYIHNIESNSIRRNQAQLQALFCQYQNGYEVLEKVSDLIAGVLFILAKGIFYLFNSF